MSDEEILLSEVGSGEAVKRMFVLDCGPHLQCPFFYNGEQCEGVPHMSSTMFGRDVPPTSTSGLGLIIQFRCEWGHEWQLKLSDHSGSTWIGIKSIKRES